jgi:TRAP-type C4-dicarboxylate transport system permease small subunit
MMKLVDRLLSWLEWPINALLWVSIVAGVAMMIHVTLDVTGRTVLNSPVAGTNEIVAGWYMVTIAFLPWAYLSRHDNHIVAGIFERMGSERFSFWLEIVVKVATIAFVIIFSWQTYLRAVQQTNAGEVWQAAGIFIPVWPSRWLLPLAGGLMGLYLVLRVIKDIHRRVQG